jgi:hypothetical protein
MPMNTILPSFDEEIFANACDLPEKERQLYVEFACGDDSVTRERVEHLLKTLAAVGFMRVPAIFYISDSAWPMSSPQNSESRRSPQTN